MNKKQILKEDNSRSEKEFLRGLNMCRESAISYLEEMLRMYENEFPFPQYEKMRVVQMSAIRTAIQSVKCVHEFNVSSTPEASLSGRLSLNPDSFQINCIK